MVFRGGNRHHPRFILWELWLINASATRKQNCLRIPMQHARHSRHTRFKMDAILDPFWNAKSQWHIQVRRCKNIPYELAANHIEHIRFFLNKTIWYLFQEARQVVVNNTSETYSQTLKSSSPSSEHSVLKPLRVPCSPVSLFMLFPCITSWADWATKFFLTFPSYYHTGCLIGIIILAY